MAETGISVLFVEDDPTMQALFKIMAAPKAGHIHLAKDGLEGWTLFQKHRPELVITDIQMPGMSGMQLLAKIREVDARVSCVILSAYSEPEYFIEAIDLGVQGFLLKPLEKQKLHRLLDQLRESILLERRMREQEEKRLEAEDNLRKLNEELELRVAARTRELENEIHEREVAQNRLRELNRDLEKRVEEELQKREEQRRFLIQKSKLESIGELAAGMAHELNQPLSGISMSLDNIDFQTKEGSLNQEYLNAKIDAMFRDIERIRHIINHVRTFSRDQEKERPERVDVGSVIRNAVSLVDQQYRNHNILLQLDIPPDALCVSGNPFRLEQVLLNLLSNAKYAVESKDRIQRENGFRKEIRLRAYRNDSLVFIEVRDNGTGIPREHIDRIFDPFFTTKGKESGTGLGLSIVYGIVKDSGGDISVDSDPGHFTSFTVRLPLIEKE